MRKLSRYFFAFILTISIYPLVAVNDPAILEEKFLYKLSDYGFFADVVKQTPSPRVIPYELISSLFSDYSYKKRFVYVPGEKKAHYHKDWVFGKIIVWKN